MYLLDTNVVSEMGKAAAGRVHPNVSAWARTVLTPHLFLSIVTVMELEIGVLLMERRDPIQGSRLRGWLEGQILPSFSGRILNIDTQIARHCAGLHVPNPTPYRDGFIAATALVHRMTVVTRNVVEFLPTGVTVLNPWQATLDPR
jgi:predicted nucleic acid-binding protein